MGDVKMTTQYAPAKEASLGYSAGPWIKSLRSPGSTLTSSMVSQSPSYSNHYRTTGKTLGCCAGGDKFDFTGRYSMSGNGEMKLLTPKVPEYNDTHYAGSKFARKLFITLQERKALQNAPDRGPKKVINARKEYVWTPPDTIIEGRLRRDQVGGFKLR